NASRLCVSIVPSSEMAGRAHAIRLDLLVVVPREPGRRVRVAAAAADAVAADAVRARTLVVARGAARDVAPRGLAAEVRRARDGPPDGLRIARVLRGGREVLRLVAALAEARAVALPARGLVAGGLDGVAAEEVVAVDELRLDRLGEQDLDAGRDRLGVA